MRCECLGRNRPKWGRNTQRGGVCFPFAELIGNTSEAKKKVRQGNVAGWRTEAKEEGRRKRKGYGSGDGYGYDYDYDYADRKKKELAKQTHGWNRVD